jgi:benzoate 4-monooxygenase
MAYIQSQHLVAALVCFILFSLIFSVFFDPLRKIPGPFWAKRTNLWKTWHTYRGDLHDVVVKLHKKCGPAIRIGPGDVNFQSRGAVDTIYKAGRAMPKTAYYDGFVPAGRVNLFTTRDETFHALRRRQMAHSFSTATLLQFEGTFNKHLDRLFTNVEHSVGTTFDMKELVACYTYDVICELAFDRDVNTQAAPSKDSLPRIPDHILLGALYGHMSSLLPYSMRLGDKLPIPGLQKLLASRRQLAKQTGEWVRSAMETHNKGDRETLLANIFEAEDPETGARLTIDEICAEAFAFL